MIFDLEIPYFLATGFLAKEIETQKDATNQKYFGLFSKIRPVVDTTLSSFSGFLSIKYLQTAPLDILLAELSLIVSCLLREKSLLNNLL